jgi:asparagine synthase (glutamine-hydrolysing)
MCGVAAIYAYHSAAPIVDRGELRRIRDHMAARGPDGCGEWFSEDGRVALGHRRLAIIDLSERGAQPMVSADGQLVISFNGEIYNYRALCKQLERKGYLFRSHSDTEVLLYLYAEKGEAMLEELRGMYALALWDGRKRGLLLARDPLGIKPLYYADDGATLQVASQVKALLKGGRVDTTSEPTGHVGFFLWGHVPEPYTFYKGIRTLPAGSTLWVDATGLHQLNHFFSLTDELTRASETALTVRHEEMQERLRTALTDSVRHPT